MKSEGSGRRHAFQDAARNFRAGRMSLAELCDRFFPVDGDAALPTASTASAAVTASAAPSAATGESLCLDLDRARRCGFPEVIFAPGKTVDELAAAVSALRGAGQPVLITRLEPDAWSGLRAAWPGADYDPLARAAWVGRSPPCPAARVAVVTGGTSDRPVAAEAVRTLEWMGIEAAFVQDVGVAGPHRLQPHVPRLAACHAIVVVAGFEGALASVIGGYVACPVVAVPRRQGTVDGLEGIAAFLAMASSCAANVAVVQIDGGFKGGYVAGLIAHQAIRHLPPSPEPPP